MENKINSMKTLTISQIQKIVCDFYRVPVAATQTKSRKRELVQSRQVTMYFARNKTKESLAQVGLEVGAKDHATVLHACKVVNNLIDTNRSFKYDIYLIERELIKLEKRILDEPEIRDIDIEDIHDYFPHPSDYPEIEFTTVKFFRPKLWIMKFRKFESKVINISERITEHQVGFTFPFANVIPCTGREHHGYRVHAI